MLQEGVDEYLSWLTHKEQGESNPNTIVAYRNDLYQLCAYLARFNLAGWRQVTREHINGYLLEMRDTQAYRPATIARKLASLKTFFRYLRGAGKLESDPVEHLDVPRIQKEPSPILNQEQVARLFDQVPVDHAAGQRDLAMIALLYATGMRVSELVALNLDDLHVAEGTIRFVRRSTRKPHDFEVRLLPPVLEVLQAYLRSARWQLILHHPGETALFVNHHGERLTRQGFWLIVKGYARQAGITGITPQMLRHSFAVLVRQDSAALRVLQEVLARDILAGSQVAPGGMKSRV
jgi:integrase/recombinase XerD